VVILQELRIKERILQCCETPEIKAALVHLLNQFPLFRSESSAVKNIFEMVHVYFIFISDLVVHKIVLNLNIFSDWGCLILNIMLLSIFCCSPSEVKLVASLILGDHRIHILFI
jgi:hypothetical protein